jgi:hypothetical protein
LKGDGQITHYVGFTHTALAAGNGNYPGRVGAYGGAIRLKAVLAESVLRFQSDQFS